MFDEHDVRPGKWGVIEKGYIIEVSYRGVLDLAYVRNDSDRAWQKKLAQWRPCTGADRLPPAAPVSNASEADRHDGWPFGFVAYYADLEELREESHTPGAQRFIPRPGDPPDATNALIVERFLAAFAEPAAATRFHRLHAKLSMTPAPARLSAFATWLFEVSHGGQLPQDDTTRWCIGRAWRELVAVAGDAKRFLAGESTGGTAWADEESKPFSGDGGVFRVSERRLTSLLEHICRIRANEGDVPNAFQNNDTENPHDIAGAFDPNRLLAAFSAVRLRPGYVLDYVWKGSIHDGAPLLYARRQAQAPHASVNAFASAEGVTVSGYAPNSPAAFLHAIEFDATPIGTVELAVFLNEVPFFYWNDHAFYERKEIISTQQARLDAIDVARAEDRSRILELPMDAGGGWKGDRAWAQLLMFQHNTGFFRQTWEVSAPGTLWGTRQLSVAPSAVRRLY